MPFRIVVEVCVAGVVTPVVVYSGETAGDIARRALHNTLGPDHSTDHEKCVLQFAGKPLSLDWKIEDLNLRDGAMLDMLLPAVL